MRRPEVIKEVQRRLRHLKIRPYLTSVKAMSAYVEVRVLIRGQEKTLHLRSGITPTELDNELWKLQHAWERNDAAQIDIEDF